MQRTLQLGRVYRHFKGDYYLAEALASDSETGRPFVVYRKLYGDGSLWLRPLDMFLSPVDKEKYRMPHRNTGLNWWRFPALPGTDPVCSPHPTPEKAFFSGSFCCMPLYKTRFSTVFSHFNSFCEVHSSLFLLF